ncbi:hypothetical protein [Dyadobacter sp. 3J3]|uniref:hypothetical protein n=1 Tax=Dyadobacter sp. 3J3 TaxID=2606600 RepID=UPI00135A3BA7|nr:hypothetical protein [Dyadobacter sp. 3J3]
MRTRIYMSFLSCFTIWGCTESSKLKLAPQTIFEKENLQVIMSGFNKRKNTSTILYGNSIGGNFGANKIKSLVPGQIFKLVTWGQKPNPYWFGGNINDGILTIETVKISGEENGYVFTEYLAKNNKGDIIHKNNAERLATIKLISDRKPSAFP